MTSPGGLITPFSSQGTLASRTSEAIGRPPDRRTGTVVSFTAGVLRVSVGGGDAEEVGYLAGYRPQVGDVVILVLQRSTWVVLDRIGDPAVPPQSQNGLQIHCVAQGNGTNVFADITNMSFPFTKHRTDSRVFALISGSCFVNATNTGADFGMRINGVEYLVASQFYNTAFQHGAVSGFTYLIGIPAGTHTVQGLFRRFFSAAGVQTDDNDRMCMNCTEVD